MRPFPWRFLLPAIAVLHAQFALAAATLGGGDRLPVLMLKDQHDRQAVFPETTSRVLLAADNSGSQKVMVLIERMGATWLKDTNTVFLADIHRMPSLIASLVALPQLRDKPYPIVLGREEADLAMFPRRKDCVTLLDLKQGVFSAPVFACIEDELREAATVR